MNSRTANSPRQAAGPGDRGNIDFVLSSSRSPCRSPWSPRFFQIPGKSTANNPPRLTNSLEKRDPGSSTRGGPNALKIPLSKPSVASARRPLLQQETVESQTEEGPGPDPKPQDPSNPTESGLGHLPVQLFVAAVGDGEITSTTPAKTREVLEQVIKKVSKEQNTVVNVKGEGPLHIQLRVFASSSVEAKALKEYIENHEEQNPCPFILLARQLPMAVTYDTAFIDPSNANVADRLRKQAKTRAIKLLREVIYDDDSGVTTAMLRGRHGPMEPATRLESLIMQRAAPLEGAAPSSSKYIAFPAVRRHGEGGAETLPPEPAGGPSADGPRTPVLAEEKKVVANHGKAGTLFPVSLTVIAIGDGQIARNTQPKLLHRLRQLTNRVPKEHHCTIDLPGEGNIVLKMRLFVANSEDAKAAREYVSANQTQRPSPFVILSHALPIAVSYDARNLDVSDANVVDCLRKQAKTRAVKLIKETIVDPQVGVTLDMLRGNNGAQSLAEHLQTPLMQRAVSFGDGKKYISFTARNRNLNDISSDRKADDDVFPALSTLANVASGGKAKEEDMDLPDDGIDPMSTMMSQQRVCEMCKAVNDGSYGTGRFCSKGCRYEAHALRVAQQRRIHSSVPAGGPGGKDDAEELTSGVPVGEKGGSSGEEIPMKTEPMEAGERPDGHVGSKRKR